jgi:hypothetical protein
MVTLPKCRHYLITVYLRYVGDSINLIICAINLLLCLVEQMFSDVPHSRKYTKRYLLCLKDKRHFQNSTLLTIIVSNIPI